MREEGGREVKIADGEDVWEEGSGMEAGVGRERE